MGYVLNRAELSRMLIRARKGRNETQRAVAKRLARRALECLQLQRSRSMEFNPNWFSFEAGTVVPTMRKFVKELESGGVGPGDERDFTFSIDDIRLISEAYHVPRLVLLSLHTKLVPGPCQVVSESDFEANANFGLGSVYEHCNRLIRGAVAEFAFVRVRIEPGRMADRNGFTLPLKMTGKQGSESSSPNPQSDTHYHDGEEILLVRRGYVLVYLHDSGLPVYLEPGDYLHFYAEQLHSAWNMSNDLEAELFVARFYQNRRGKRAGSLKELGKFIARSSRGRLRKPEMSLLFQSHDQDFARVHEDRGEHAPGDRPVLDPFGLARFLKLVAKCYAMSLEDLATAALKDLATAAGEPRDRFYSRSKIDRIQNGLSAVDERDFLSLGKIYGCEPLLFYNYIVPPFLYAIAVSHHVDEADLPRSLVAWQKVPPAYFQEALWPSGKSPAGSRIQYWVPARRLTDSDVAVVLVELGDGSETLWNRHPGFEMLFPLGTEGDGEFRIEIQLAEPKSVRIGVDLFGFYDSRRSHKVSFRSARGPASRGRALVFRFLDDQPAEPPEDPDYVV